jgi:hypothetical protein
MATLIWLVIMACSLASLICWIMVLIPLFKNEGVLMGILGIICGLYPFIWGWMKAKQYKLQTVMLVWTVAFVLVIVLQVVGVGAMGAMQMMQ